MVPGRIEGGDKIDLTDVTKYRTYFSTDFLKGEGNPRNSADGPSWPIWDTSENDTLKFNRYFGYYINPVEERNTNYYKKGPAFISGEDVFTTYKDTDLEYYEGGIGFRRNLGYPMKLQYEQTIYSWGFGDYKDFLFIKYNIINFSKDTLYNCWLAPVMDIDIARATSSAAGADNDRVRFYDEEDTLNLAVQWTNDNRDEKGRGFGYLGFDFLESPAIYRCEEQFDSLVDGKNEPYCRMCTDYKKEIIFDIDTATGNKVNYRDTLICIAKLPFSSKQIDYVRNDRRFYRNSDQLGLKTFRNWPISEDRIEDNARYEFMASKLKDGDNGPGDKRFMMATGPFNFKPGDSVRVVVGMIIGNAVKPDADGSTEDMAELVRKDKFAQYVYDNNFKAPKPPDESAINWEGYNNAVKITWDNTSELTIDKEESGLDFLGYRLYRARRDDLDTFNIDQITGNAEYTRGKGPLGWKQIGQWEIPTVCWKSTRKAGIDPKNLKMPYIDSLRVVGPYIDPVTNKIDLFSIRVMRVAHGLMLASSDKWIFNNMKRYDPSWNNYFGPIIMEIDTSAYMKPWSTYLDSISKGDKFPLYYDPINISKNKSKIFSEVLIGRVKLNRALLDYNPLLWDRVSETILPADTVKMQIWDTNLVKNLIETIRTVYVNGTPTLMIDRLRPISYLTAMTDTLRVNRTLDSIYSYLQRGLAKIEFPEFEQSAYVRKEIITPYMASISNNRTFFDIGDDDHTADIRYNEDPTKTEKLLNNIDYYYKMLAYDEGDHSLQTEGKMNNAALGLTNYVKAYPKASAPSNDLQFNVTSIDQNKMGGLSNFKMFSIDPERTTQLYAGHEFELEINPDWMVSFVTFKDNAQKDVPKHFGLYRRNLVLRDITDNNKVVFNATTLLEQNNCSWMYQNSFTEDAISWLVDYKEVVDTLYNDTIRFNLPTNDDRIVRSGTFSTGDFTRPGYCYTFPFIPEAFGTLGFDFDYTIEQRGGRYRPDPSSASPTSYVKTNAKTPIQIITDGTADPDSNLVMRTQIVASNTLMKQFTASDANPGYGYRTVPSREYQSYNNGPGDYLVTFKAGGIDTMTVVSDLVTTPTKFICNYLTMDIKNTATMEIPDGKGGKTNLTYPDPVEKMDLPYPVKTFSENNITGADTARFFPDPRNLLENGNQFINKYNLAASAFLNGRNVSPLNISKAWARPSTPPYNTLGKTTVGKQNRYYLSAYSVDNGGKDTLDFVHILNISGAQFAFDYAKKERRFKGQTMWSLTADQKSSFTPGMPDFAEGDEIKLKTTGGAFGLPLPGAKVRFKIENNVPQQNELTDSHLDQIGIVPNPYYISHQGQRSSYDAKIYFTKLPKKCTIEIYTTMGDLIASLDHDEFTSQEPNKMGVELWDLLSRNGQRVQSQSMIAIIKTPNGAQTVKKFSVVVGGFRLIGED
jgi:hypothetical protein